MIGIFRFIWCILRKTTIRIAQDAKMLTENFFLGS